MNMAEAGRIIGHIYEHGYAPRDVEPSDVAAALRMHGLTWSNVRKWSSIARGAEDSVGGRRVWNDLIDHDVDITAMPNEAA